MDRGGLIVGLGNPGPDYEHTRHNLGFMVLDTLMRELERRPDAGLTTAKSEKSLYALWQASIGGDRWLLAKPLTYMNRSGQAVGRICRYFKLEPEQVLVVHDELDLPLGRLRLKQGGGTAGHKGLNSIVEHLGTREFYRLRLGIGKADAAIGTDHVLGRLRGAEAEIAGQAAAAAAEGVELFCRQGFEPARNFVGGFRPDIQHPADSSN
jgi:PTH1 family peptidyl-tRNA hydrolase